jgi:hypothetical protein
VFSGRSEGRALRNERLRVEQLIADADGDFAEHQHALAGEIVERDPAAAADRLTRLATQEAADGAVQ